MNTLGSYVIRRREELGMSKQIDLARASGIPDTTINRIEKGTTKLPSADVRRKLAKALEVSHLDILIEAGEITHEEVTSIGVEGVKPPNPIRDELIALIDDYPRPLMPDMIELFRAVLRYRVGPPAERSE